MSGRLFKYATIPVLMALVAVLLSTMSQITFQEILTLTVDSDGNYTIDDYISDVSNIIYLREGYYFGQSCVNSGEIEFNFYDSRLGLYTTEDYVNKARNKKAYAVQDRTQTESSFTDGDYLEYGTPSSGTPAFDITMYKVGYTSDGRHVDMVTTYQYVYVERDWTVEKLDEDYDIYPCFIHFYSWEPATSFSIESG